ncbi:hypothetical protein [Zoogloea sp.]|uniref:hypothetical protein n=1 Tax=Zoogloea sp. TaxID=49181 RepID=UPI0035B44080
MQLTTHRPTRAGWYWAQIPGSRPLQPVLVFDGGDGFSLLYTWDAIDQGHSDADHDGLPVDLSAPSMLWSEAPIPAPTSRAGMAPAQRAVLGIVMAFGLGVLVTLDRAEADTAARVTAVMQSCADPLPAGRALITAQGAEQ